MIYTALRIGLFVVCYVVFAGLWALLFGTGASWVIGSFLIAAVVSAILSLKLLKGPRERFAEHVDARARRAAARFEEMRAKEDAD